MIPFDIYVLASDRSAATVERFLRQLAAGMEEAAVDYPIPQYADEPTNVYSHLSELTAYLVQERNVGYSVYFRRTGTTQFVRSALLQFTSDGRLIVGLTVYAPASTDLETYLKELAVTVGGSYGYWTVEEPPPSSAMEFIEAVRQADQPKLIPEAQ